MLYYENKVRKKGFKFIAGIDEAGRGPLAGPVVAASVVLGKNLFYEKIYDSKRLSPKKRGKAFFEIVRYSLVSVGIVDNLEIDRINILNATKKAMVKAVLGLGMVPDCLLIDGNMRLDLPLYQNTIIGGDSKSLSVAAASIVAKVVRDSMMLKFDGLYPEYEFRKHKGYGTKRHFDLLKDHGLCPLHRISFIPLELYGSGASTHKTTVR